MQKFFTFLMLLLLSTLSLVSTSYGKPNSPKNVKIALQNSLGHTMAYELPALGNKRLLSDHQQDETPHTDNLIVIQKAIFNLKGSPAISIQFSLFACKSAFILKKSFKAVASKVGSTHVLSIVPERKDFNLQSKAFKCSDAQKAHRKFNIAINENQTLLDFSRENFKTGVESILIGNEIDPYYRNTISDLLPNVVIESVNANL